MKQDVDDMYPTTLGHTIKVSVVVDWIGELLLIRFKESNTMSNGI